MAVIVEYDNTRKGGRPRSEKNDPLVDKVPPLVAAWSAGVIESRGTIVETAYHGLRFTIQMHGPQGVEVLGRLRKYYGGSISTIYENRARWTLTGGRIFDMLARIRPFLSKERLNEFAQKRPACGTTTESESEKENGRDSENRDG